MNDDTKKKIQEILQNDPDMAPGEFLKPIVIDSREPTAIAEMFLALFDQMNMSTKMRIEATSHAMAQVLATAIKKDSDDNAGYSAIETTAKSTKVLFKRYRDKIDAVDAQTRARTEPMTDDGKYPNAPTTHTVQ